MNVTDFIGLSDEQKRDKLLHCCYCTSWADDVLEALEKLESTSLISTKMLTDLMRASWSTTDEDGYLQAFSAHPKIGDIKVLEDKFASQAHAEQGQVTQAKAETLKALMVQNENYLQTFGFIFIICATGKSAEKMLASLLARIDNSREQEIKNAAAEQEKIMLLRLSQIIE